MATRSTWWSRERVQAPERSGDARAGRPWHEVTGRFAGLVSRLRGHPPHPAPEGSPEHEAPCTNPVLVHLFQADRMVAGTLCGAHGRVSDTVNRVAGLRLVDATVTDLASHSASTVPALDVSLDQVLLIIPGDQPPSERRIWTRRRRVEIAVGGFAVFGELHGPAAADPIANLHRRPGFVPLTDATIVAAASGASLAAAPAVIVNTAAATSIRDAGHDRILRSVAAR